MAKHLVLAGMLAGLMPLTGAAAQPIDSTLETAISAGGSATAS